MTSNGAARLLSVPELQQAIAIATSRSAQRHTVTSVTLRAAAPGHRPDGSAAASTTAALPAPGQDGGGGLWITVLAAHHAAGASTVALALADAAAGDGSPARLIDCAAPGESGLTDAATSVLGVDAAGRWYRGRRGRVTIEHATESTPSAPAPAHTAPLEEQPYPLTVVDGGTASAGHGDPLPRDQHGAAGGVVVIVCQATVPGVRQAEALLARLTAPVIVAVIGPRKWPGVVTASVGAALRAVQATGRLVPVPYDPQLAATGLTGDPLPRKVLSAAHAVVNLAHATAPATPSIQPLTAAHPVPIPKENLS